jgi:hypothetical protein
MNKFVFSAGVLSLAALLQLEAQAQTQNIQARISGGGGSGKCTFEVVVNGSAEVQISGTQGRLRTLSGQPATWRRLNCNQALPRNPNNFRFAGVDGHGKQYLVSNPSNSNGVAVIRIDNNRNNMEGYTGDIMWNGGTNGGGWQGGNGSWPGGGNNNGPWQPGMGSNVSPRVVPNCQNAIRNKLVGQYGGNLTFRGQPQTQQAGSFIMVQGGANYRDGSGKTGDIQYNCTMHPNGNVADSKYTTSNPYPQPR